MNRRALLASLLFGPGARQVLSSVASLKIIDAHVHFYDTRRPRGVPWPPKDDKVLYGPRLPVDYEKMVRPLGVVGAIAIEASALFEDNAWVLNLAKTSPIITGFVGHLDPGKPGFEEHLARFRPNPLFRGIRISNRQVADALKDDAVLRNLQALADAGLTLDAIGPGAMATDVATLSVRVPKLKIIIDHVPVGFSAADLQTLGSKPNIYAKVSGVLHSVDGRVPTDLNFYRDSLNAVWNAFGPDRVVYASNWPVSDRLASYANVLRVVREYFQAKGAKTLTKYFYANALAFYRGFRAELLFG